jgi:sugar lactone lactonase YvrE
MNSLRFNWAILLLAAAPFAVVACDGDEDDGDDGGAAKGGTSGEAGSGTSGASGKGGSGGKGGSSGSDSGGAPSSGGAGGEDAGGAAGESTAGAGGAGDGVLDAGGRVIELTPERFFPEGVTVDKNGNFYIGSMELGVIYRGTANGGEAEPFIEPDAENELVSVIGVHADDATDTLWVCSSDAGNSAQAGDAPAALKKFSLPNGEFVESYAWPEFSGDALPEEMTNGVTGFCNDITIDADGNLYATDSWYPRILRLPAGGTALEEWVVSDVFPQDQWHLNGIDVDQSNGTLYVVENHPGALYSIPIMADGTAGEVAEVTTSRDLLSPDGLKVLAPNLLVTAEGANDGGGVAYIRIDDAGEGEIEEVIKGFNQVATLALFQASAWVVENQGDHFWGAAENGPDADPPFRVVEVPLAIGAGAAIIETTTDGFFPEGVTLDAADNFYVGSMNTGAIHKAAADDTETAPFIEADAENGLVSVLGLYATDDTLWVCNSDAGNGELAGDAPAALKAFDLATGDLVGSWDWPAYADPLPEADTGGVTGFCNDITVDADGNVYATDSWYPRILRLPAGATETDMLEEWVVSTDVFPAGQWHLNGIDIDATNDVMYVVENHPGALYAIEMLPNGNAGMVSAVTTSRPLYSPDGLKVVGDGVLAIAEGQTGGMSIIELDGSGVGQVRRISTGLDGIATFALRSGSAWLVENQGDHFWGDAPDPVKPFRLVEVPLNLP